MPKFQASVNGGASVEYDQPLPYVLSVTSADAVAVEGIGSTVTLAAVSATVATNIADASVANEVTNADGSLTFELLNAGTYTGTYTVSAAAMDGGYPSIFAEPTISTVGTDWVVNDDGLYAWPTADAASVLIEWVNGTQVIGTGPTHPNNEPLTADDKIEAVVKLTNIAADTDDKRPVVRLTAKVGVVHPASPIVMRDNPAQSKATLDLTGTADVQRLVIGMWGIKQDTATKYPLQGTITGGTQLLSIQDGFGTGGVKIRSHVTSINAGTLTQNIISSPGDFVVDDRFVVVFTAEVGQPVRGFGSANGDPQVVGAAGNTIAAGSTIRVETAALKINNNWNGVRDRIAIWSPATMPDFTDPAVWYELVDKSGKMKDPARADELLGTPLLDDRGDAAAFNAGTHYGSWNAGVFTVVNAAVDYTG